MLCCQNQNFSDSNIVSINDSLTSPNEVEVENQQKIITHKNILKRGNKIYYEALIIDFNLVQYVDEAGCKSL